MNRTLFNNLSFDLLLFIHQYYIYRYYLFITLNNDLKCESSRLNFTSKGKKHLNTTILFGCEETLKREKEKRIQ